MDILVGSRALNFHKKIKSYEFSDWDLISDNPQQHFLVDFLDITEPTNKIIFDLLNHSSDKNIIESPIGKVIIAPLEILKVLKISSLIMKTHKTNEDLLYLKDVKISKKMNIILNKRINETKCRIQKQKFFNKSVQRIVNHDDIHNWISNNNPLFKKILKEKSSVLGSKDKFLSLSYSDKMSLVCEELFVFCIERNLIPQVIREKSSIKLVMSRFGIDSPSSPYYYWLNKFSVNNGVKRYPTYISEFIRKNKKNITEHAYIKWDIYLSNLPVSFWNKILD